MTVRPMAMALAVSMLAPSFLIPGCFGPQAPAAKPQIGEPQRFEVVYPDGYADRVVCGPSRFLVDGRGNSVSAAPCTQETSSGNVTVDWQFSPLAVIRWGTNASHVYSYRPENDFWVPHESGSFLPLLAWWASPLVSSPEAISQRNWTRNPIDDSRIQLQIAETIVINITYSIGAIPARIEVLKWDFYFAPIPENKKIQAPFNIEVESFALQPVQSKPPTANRFPTIGVTTKQYGTKGNIHAPSLGVMLQENFSLDSAVAEAANDPQVSMAAENVEALFLWRASWDSSESGGIEMESWGLTFSGDCKENRLVEVRVEQRILAGTTARTVSKVTASDACAWNRMPADAYPSQWTIPSYPNFPLHSFSQETSKDPLKIMFLTDLACDSQEWAVQVGVELENEFIWFSANNGQLLSTYAKPGLGSGQFTDCAPEYPPGTSIRHIFPAPNGA